MARKHGCLFFIPQTGQISETRPQSNYRSFRIPREKRAFIEGWLEVGDPSPHGLSFPAGFHKTLVVLDRMCRRK